MTGGLTKSPPPERPINRRRELRAKTMLFPMIGQSRGGLSNALLAEMASPE